MYSQVQINRMLQDNMMILDTALRAVSSAEKLAFGKKEGKKYSGYDENDTASWRNKKELKSELMTKIQCLNGMMTLYSKRYPGKNLNFPDDLSKEEILYDIENFRKEAIKNKDTKNYEKYYIDLYNLLNVFKCQKYTTEEILEGIEQDKDNAPRNENDVSNLARKFFKITDKVEKQEEKFINDTNQNGGRFTYKFKKGNMNKREENNYYKNFYNHDQCQDDYFDNK